MATFNLNKYCNSTPSLVTRFQNQVPLHETSHPHEHPPNQPLVLPIPLQLSPEMSQDILRLKARFSFKQRDNIRFGDERFGG